MSDNFIDKNNANLTRHAAQLAEFGGKRLTELLPDGGIARVSDDEIQIQCDHMYATHREHRGEPNGLRPAAAAVGGGGGGAGADDGARDATTQPPCQQQEQEQRPSAESEVNFIKDFLLIHLDLIQQQNDEIVNKDNTIFLLQQENQQLREEKKLLESQLAARVAAANEQAAVVDANSALNEDMIIDSTTIVVEQIEQAPILRPASNLPVAVGIPEEESIETSEHIEVAPAEPDQQELQLPIVATIKAELPESDCNDYSNSSYTIHSSGSDQMKNLKMSIRRKRLCSNTSTLSNNGSTSASEEKKLFRHQTRKKRKRVKNDEVLTHPEEFITQAGEHVMDIVRRQELAEEVAKAANSASLEVPRWRGKVYTSCYSLEGTENLDDEVFLRRHSRMENDEKRRKRWDFQRIREQRVIEKLKQRQDKIDSNNKSSPIEPEPEPISSLWPSMEDVKFIEICENLPVAAFGAPVPKIQPSEFSLPWLSNLSLKKPMRRSGTITRRRRRSSKR